MGGGYSCARFEFSSTLATSVVAAPPNNLKNSRGSSPPQYPAWALCGLCTIASAITQLWKQRRVKQDEVSILLSPVSTYCVVYHGLVVSDLMPIMYFWGGKIQLSSALNASLHANNMNISRGSAIGGGAVTVVYAELVFNRTLFI